MARYGWGLDYLYSMRPRDYYRVSQAALEAQSKDARETLTVEAFGAWLAGNGGKRTFHDYLKQLGLGDTNTKPRTTKEEGIALARSIAERDRARTVQNRRQDST